MRNFAYFLGALVVAGISLTASAQSKSDASKVSVYGGYSYLHYSNGTGNGNTENITANANGFVVAAAYNFTHMFAVVGEYSFDHLGTLKVGGTTIDNTSGKMQTYLFGPKVTFANHSPIKPFAQVLIGGAHANFKISGGGLSETGPAANGLGLALGGGLDWKLNHHWAIRPVQFDYLMTRFSNNENSGDVPPPGDGGSGTQNNFRYSGGVVYNF